MYFPFYELNPSPPHSFSSVIECTHCQCHIAMRAVKRIGSPPLILSTPNSDFITVFTGRKIVFASGCVETERSTQIHSSRTIHTTNNVIFVMNVYDVIYFKSELNNSKLGRFSTVWHMVHWMRWQQGNLILHRACILYRSVSSWETKHKHRLQITGACVFIWTRSIFFNFFPHDFERRNLGTCVHCFR